MAGRPDRGALHLGSDHDACKLRKMLPWTILLWPACCGLYRWSHIVSSERPAVSCEPSSCPLPCKNEAIFVRRHPLHGPGNENRDLSAHTIWMMMHEQFLRVFGRPVGAESGFELRGGGAAARACLWVAHPDFLAGNEKGGNSGPVSDRCFHIVPQHRAR